MPFSCMNIFELFIDYIFHIYYLLCHRCVGVLIFKKITYLRVHVVFVSCICISICAVQMALSDHRQLRWLNNLSHCFKPNELKYSSHSQLEER